MRVTMGSRPGESGATTSPVRSRSLNTAPGGALSPILVAPCHYSCSCPIKLKKPLRGFSCRHGNFLQRNSSRGGDRFCHYACIRWFRAFPAKRDGRQIWAIGLHHEFPKRNLCRNFSHSHAVFESNNSGERNEVVEIENFICLIKRAPEAVKNAAQFPRARPHDSKRVFPCVALM